MQYYSTEMYTTIQWMCIIAISIVPVVVVIDYILEAIEESIEKFLMNHPAAYRKIYEAERFLKSHSGVGHMTHGVKVALYRAVRNLDRAFRDRALSEAKNPFPQHFSAF